MQNTATIHNGQAIGPEEIQQMEAFHREKVKARNEEKGSRLKKVGNSAKAGGVAAGTAGKSMQVAGKGVKMAGKGMQVGGRAMMKAGTELSATGLGAVVGVPLAVAGGVTNLAGGGARAAGSAMDAGGKGVSKTGKGMRSVGKNLNVVSRLRQAKNKAGLEGAVKNKIEKKIEDVVKKKILCGTPVVSALYGAYVFFIDVTTVNKKKKISFGLWDWLLLIISNIEMIAFAVAGLAIVVFMVEFKEASLVDKVGMAYKSFIGIGWHGMKSLYDLFH